MEFKYYKRGAGELDTSNFPDIVAAGEVTVGNLDEKTFVSLLALNQFLLPMMKTVAVKVKGYVAHMRSDKDIYPMSKLYDYLPFLDIEVESIQHESTKKIKSATIDVTKILTDLGLSYWYTQFIGADSSVHKFFPNVNSEAQKVRENGKVVSMDFDLGSPRPKYHRIVIVDDILGGGATVQMLVDTIRDQGFEGEIYLWIQYDEGIAKPEFYEQFEGVYVGQYI